MRGEPFKAFPKDPIASKVTRGLKRESRQRDEDTEKAKVRKRDKRCRFPLCGCQRFKLRIEVSHSRHKGMGGNPAGDRSDASLMLLLCSARHKENRIAIDHGTLKWIPQTNAGANGPIAWLVDLQALGRHPNHTTKAWPWALVAREASVGVFEAWSPFQREILEQLRQMIL